MGSVLDINFQSAFRGTRVIYTIPLKIYVPKYQIKVLWIQKCKERVQNGGLTAEPPAGGVEGP